MSKLLEIYSINLQLDFRSGICYTGDTNMLKIQLKDNCWLCLGLQQDCVTCDGSGEIITWVPLEELAERIEEIQKRKEEKEKFFAPTEALKKLDVKDLEVPPNINI